ncbi:MAG: PPC domain-containing protein [Phycisphaerales bacterium]|nr:PPC domain-containing protein [Phycisphaerales bacterium]
MNKIFAMSVAAMALAAGTANAGLILETESNNSAATANNIGTFNVPGGSVLVDGTITPGSIGQAGDVDWFRFTVGGTATVVASIFSLNNVNADSELWLIGSDGTTILAYNDDGNVNGGSGNMSSLIQANLAPGNYFLVISGFNDGGASNNLPDGFVGDAAPVPGQTSGHTQNFDYKFIVGFNVIPTPGAAALLGLGGLAMARRRR